MSDCSLKDMSEPRVRSGKAVQIAGKHVIRDGELPSLTQVVGD